MPSSLAKQNSGKNEVRKKVVMTAWKDDGKEHSNKCKRHPEQNFMTPHSNARTKEYFKFAKNANFPGPAAQ